jgi:hypothetical protein
VPSASFALWQHNGYALYAVAAAITTVLAGWQSRPGSTDVFGLSAVMLGANVLLLSATLRVLIGDFKDSRADFMIPITLLTTLIMAAALTGTARWIMSVAAQPLNAKETV